MRELATTDIDRQSNLQRSERALQAQIADLERKVDEVELAKAQEASEKRQLVAELQEAQIERASNTDLEKALASWKEYATGAAP